MDIGQLLHQAQHLLVIACLRWLKKALQEARASLPALASCAFELQSTFEKRRSSLTSAAVFGACSSLFSPSSCSLYQQRLLLPFFFPATVVCSACSFSLPYPSGVIVSLFPFVSFLPSSSPLLRCTAASSRHNSHDHGHRHSL